MFTDGTSDCVKVIFIRQHDRTVVVFTDGTCDSVKVIFIC